MCSARLGSRPCSWEPSAHTHLLLLQLYTPSMACTSISGHNSCFPPRFCLPPQSLYLSQSLSVHLGKFANRTKIATNGYYSYSTNYVPERPQDSLLLFPSSKQIPVSLGTTFPSLPCYQVKSCDCVLINEMWVGVIYATFLSVSPKYNYTQSSHLLTLFPYGLPKQKSHPEGWWSHWIEFLHNFV